MKSPPLPSVRNFLVNEFYFIFWSYFMVSTFKNNYYGIFDLFIWKIPTKEINITTHFENLIIKLNFIYVLNKHIKFHVNLYYLLFDL